jgi:predicted protein tyrosine phosphatase
MNFVILSKAKASLFTSPLRYAVIQIVSHDDVHPPLQEGYVDAIQLKFFDIDIKIDIYPGIKPDDARRILEFTEKNKNLADLFVVHCNAGISRSAGAAAALSHIYNEGDDSWVFRSPRYIPNMLVYKTILKEAQKIGLIS